MLSSRPALNWAKWASRRLIGLLEFERGQRIAQHRRGRIHSQHDRLAVEAMDPEIIGDLPDNLEHCGPAAAAAEKREHVDRAIDRPLDIFVEQGGEVCRAGGR